MSGPVPLQTPSASSPTQVGEWTLLAKIGEGGMGVVHLARRDDGSPTGQRVALKVLRPHVVGDDEARQRLAREVASLGRVRSRWVAEIVDADPWGDVPWVATRYVPGYSLHRHVAEEGAVEKRDLLWFAACLAEGVNAVHEVGVLHRDVKPSNVVLEGRTPVLIDFGLARLADDPRLTMAGWLLGTPGYLAPEILYGEDATTASDVHAWAATVAFAATGRPPFGGGPAMAVMDRPRRAQHDLDGLTGPLHDVVAACLDPDPWRRPGLAAVLEWLRPQTTRPGPLVVAPPVDPDADDPFTAPLAMVAADAAGSAAGPDLAPDLEPDIDPDREDTIHLAGTTWADAGLADAAVEGTSVLPFAGPRADSGADVTDGTLVLPVDPVTVAQPVQQPVQPPVAPLPSGWSGPAPRPVVTDPPDTAETLAPPDPADRLPDAPVQPARHAAPTYPAPAQQSPYAAPPPGAPPYAGPQVAPWAPPRASFGERFRRGVLVTAGAGVVGAGLALAPWVALTVVTVGTWLLRSGSLAAQKVGHRRSLRGRKWYDGPVLLVGAPAYLLRTLPSTVLLLLWSAGLALSVGLLGYAVAAPLEPVLLVAGTVLAMSTWVGPGGARVRSPLMRLMRPAARDTGTWLLWALVLLGLAVGGALAASALGVAWFPADAEPFTLPR
ncbi:MAG: hypothetical protein CMH83_17810 [Nocardioides sp.]|nr:hypothetical protein [Nocardioides sp.]